MPAATGDASAKLAQIAASLRLAGTSDAKGIRLQLVRGLRAGAKPMVTAAKDSAAQRLPREGGLADRVSKGPIKTSVRTAARTAGVRITASHHDAKATNDGYVRHPVFGHMDRFVRQELPDAKGWWSEAMESKQPEATAELYRVLREYSEALSLGSLI